MNACKHNIERINDECKLVLLGATRSLMENVVLAAYMSLLPGTEHRQRAAQRINK